VPSLSTTPGEPQPAGNPVLVSTGDQSGQTEQLDLDTLSRTYGRQQVLVEAQRLSLVALSQNANSIREVLTTGNLDALQSITQEALGSAATLSHMSDGSIESFFEGVDISEDTKEVVSTLTPLIQKHRDVLAEAISRYAEERGLDFQGDRVSLANSLLLSHDLLASIDTALLPKKQQLQATQEMMLTNYESILATLQHTYLSGGDIRDQLIAIPRGDILAELLDSLVIELDNVPTKIGDSREFSPTIQAALRYRSLLKLWQEARFTIDGRINHVVMTRSTSYYDYERDYPQVEIRFFSPTKELFFIKDDIDDVMTLAETMLDWCSQAVHGLQRAGQKMPVPIAENLVRITTNIDKQITDIRNICQETLGDASNGNE